jgi:hypothetical protein
LLGSRRPKQSLPTLLRSRARFTRACAQALAWLGMVNGRLKSAACGLELEPRSRRLAVRLTSGIFLGIGHAAIAHPEET